MAREPGGPRVRYIGFRVTTPEPLARAALIEAIRDTGRRSDPAGFAAAEPWLTRFDGSLGILRCHHHAVESARGILAALDEARGKNGTVPVRIETLATAGTIRSLVDGALAGLRDRGDAPRAAR